MDINKKLADRLEENESIKRLQLKGVLDQIDFNPYRYVVHNLPIKDELIFPLQKGDYQARLTRDSLTLMDSKGNDIKFFKSEDPKDITVNYPRTEVRGVHVNNHLN